MTLSTESMSEQTESCGDSLDPRWVIRDLAAASIPDTSPKAAALRDAIVASFPHYNDEESHWQATAQTAKQCTTTEIGSVLVGNTPAGDPAALLTVVSVHRIFNGNTIRPVAALYLPQEQTIIEATFGILPSLTIGRFRAKSTGHERRSGEYKQLLGQLAAGDYNPANTNRGNAMSERQIRHILKIMHHVCETGSADTEAIARYREQAPHRLAR